MDCDLEFLAMSWLRFEKRCPVALFERSPRPHHGKPDVLGISQDRYLLEIEIKRSLSDFKANGKKLCIQSRNAILSRGFECDMWPLYYWFLVPSSLVASIEPLLPEWAGLLRGPTDKDCQQVASVVKAEKNKASKRLTLREMVKLANCMANQIYAQELRLRDIRHRVANIGSDCDWATEFHI